MEGGNPAARWCCGAALAPCAKCCRERAPMVLVESEFHRSLPVTGPPSSLRVRDREKKERTTLSSLSCLRDEGRCVSASAALWCAQLDAGGRHLWRGAVVEGVVTHRHTDTRTLTQCNRLRGDWDGGKRHARGGNSVGTFPLVHQRRSSSLWRDAPRIRGKLGS